MSLVTDNGVDKVYAAAEAPGGSGTAADPYLITTAGNLQWISENIATVYDKHFKQTNDIDCTGVNFAPIGTEARSFTGTYDGNGRSIFNLSINPVDTVKNAGLFGNISSPGTVKNVTLKNSTILCSHTISFSCVGVIAGYCGSGVIQNCSVVGTTVEARSITANVGGVAGNVQSSIISNCSSTATVIGAATAGTSSSLGGIAGYTRDTTLQNCYFTGSFTGDPSTGKGGIIGNRYNTPNVSGNYFLNSSATYGIASDSNNNGASPKTSAELQNQATFSGWDFNTVWFIQAGSYPQLRVPPLSSGDITSYAAGNTVTVTGRAPGDIIKVYDAASSGNLIGSGTVAAGQTSVIINVADLASLSEVFVSAMTSERPESGRTQNRVLGILTLPITEDFENGGSLPDDWSYAPVIGTSLIWSCIGEETTDAITVSPHGGSYMAKANAYDAGNDVSARLFIRSFPPATTGCYNFSF